MAEKATGNTDDLMPRKSELPVLDLDIELAESNVSVAELVILSGVVKGGEAVRERLLQLVTPDFFAPKLFPRYLFELVLKCLRENGHVSISLMQEQIPDFGPKVWGEQSSGHSLRGDYFTWAQILNFDPTEAQIDRAVELVRDWAQERGYLPAEGTAT